MAASVGFQDLRTFERAFKRHTGQTPRDFKRSVALEILAPLHEEEIAEAAKVAAVVEMPRPDGQPAAAHRFVSPECGKRSVPPSLPILTGIAPLPGVATVLSRASPPPA